MKVYSGIEQLRPFFDSFNYLYDLALDGDYSPWYSKGYWDESLIPFFIVKDDIVVANVSVAPMQLVSCSKNIAVLQISTVMTHPDYRMQGLSAYLMDYVMNKYKNQYEFMYLFANESVLDFYPKFGFERVDESSYKLKNLSFKEYIKTSWIKLCPDNIEDLKLLEILIQDASSLRSKKLAFKNTQCLTMFHFILQFEESLYYCKELNCLVIMEYDDEVLRIYDVFSKEEVDWNYLIKCILKEGIEEVQFFFIPNADFDGQLEIEKDPFDDDALFIYPNKRDLLPEHFMFPITSHF